MQPQRAKDITNSLGVIEVHYQGSPIWIENVEGDKASVRYLESKNSFVVPVNDLVEVSG